MKRDMNGKFKKRADYEYALILGLTIGLFLLPLVSAFNLAFPGFLLDSVLFFGFPLLSLAYLFIAKSLFKSFTVLWEFSKYFLVGTANTAVHFGVLNILINITGVTRGWPLLLITAVSFTAAVVHSYIWSTHWAFNASKHRTHREFQKFFEVSFVSLLLSITVVFLITDIFNTGPNTVLLANCANAVAAIVALFSNFIGYKLLVFNPKKY